MPTKPTDTFQKTCLHIIQFQKFQILFYPLSRGVRISLSYEKIHPFFQKAINDSMVMVSITINKKPKYRGKSSKLSRLKPSKLNTLSMSDNGSTMAEKTVNTRIVSFICKEILAEKSSLVEFIVS